MYRVKYSYGCDSHCGHGERDYYSGCYVERQESDCHQRRNHCGCYSNRPNYHYCKCNKKGWHEHLCSQCKSDCCGEKHRYY